MQKGSAFKVMNVFHKALLMGQLFFAAVCTYLIYSKTIDPVAPELEKILQVAALALAFGGIYGGMLLFKKKLLQIRDLQTDAKEKFALYRAACFLQWALVEGPAVFCSVCLLLTGNYAFLALAVVVMFLFVMIGPSKLKMQLQLQLTESELEEL